MFESRFVRGPECFVLVDLGIGGRSCGKRIGRITTELENQSMLARAEKLEVIAKARMKIANRFGLRQLHHQIHQNTFVDSFGMLGTSGNFSRPVLRMVPTLESMVADPG